jgi:prevent-host-death family protein
MAIIINSHQAKTHLSRLLEQAAAGTEIVIAKAGKPMARLVPLETPQTRKKLGTLKGKIEIPADFNNPLPDAVLKSFEGG